LRCTRTFDVFKNDRRAELGRFVRFALTGVLNTAVDFAVFTVLTYLLGAGTYISQAIAYSAGILNSYLVNRSWTFQSRENFWSRQMVRFILVNLALLLVSVIVIWFLFEQLGLPKLLAKIMATGVTVVLGFAANRLWVFKKTNDQAS
jgi:putative flippase GtrA